MNTLFELSADAVSDTSDDWYTPRWLFDAAGLVFDVDVAAPVDSSRRTCPAARYLTPLEDGLAVPWSGTVWCNPPFSRPGPWVDRWAAHPSGLILLSATKSASTARLLAAAHAVTFFTGQFYRPNGGTDHIPWLLVLAARGELAVQALERVAAARNTPAWRPTLV